MIDKPRWLTVDLLNRMKNEVDQHPSRQQFVNDAPKYRQWYEGQRGLQPVPGHDDMAIDDRQATARRNMIGEIVDETESIFMKNWPIVRRTPFRPEDADTADVIDAIWFSEWRHSYGQFVLASVLHDAMLNGLGMGKVVWNPYARSINANGAVAIFPRTPAGLRVDPFATNALRATDARYIIDTVRWPMRAIRSHFPEEGPVALGDRKRSGRRSKRSKGEFDDVEKGGTASGELVDAMEDVEEFWIWPQTMGFSELTSGDPLKADKYKYGLVATMVNEHIVRVMPNPAVTTKTVKQQTKLGVASNKRVEVGHRRSPFFFLYWKRATDSEGKHGVYDCIGMVQWMELMQFNYDAIRRNIAINARTTANPPVAVNEDMLDQPLTSLTLAPAQILRVSQGIEADRAVKILNPGVMPNYVFNFVAGEERGMRETAGVKPGVSSPFPDAGGTSHTPEGTIGMTQGAAFGPLWKYVAELGMALLDISILYDGLIQQKYKPDMYVAKTRTGMERYVEWNDRHITANFDREVVAGATTPLYDIDKISRLTAMKEITDIAIQSGDPRQMRSAIIHLENLDDPWRWDYVELLRSEMEQAELMQQQAQQMGMQRLLSQQGSLPQVGGDTLDMSGIEALAAEAGVPVEQVLANIEG